MKSGQYYAGFISPDGKAFPAEITHIGTIIKYPMKFGLAIEDITALYEKYEEIIGVEGNARKEIILNLVQSGWIRLRRYPNKYWSVNVYTLDTKTRSILQKWADHMIKGTGGYKEADMYMPVKLNLSNENSLIIATVVDIAQDIFIITGEEPLKDGCNLIYLDSIKDYDESLTCSGRSGPEYASIDVEKAFDTLDKAEI